MTKTITPSSNTKAGMPPRATAIDRIHLKLDAMVNRLRSEIWIGGALAIGTATMVSLLAMLVIDAIFQPESTWLRVALWFPLVGVVGIVTRQFLITPLKQECDRFTIAWTLEQKRPTIEERVITSLQLSENPNRKTSSLVEAVAQQAQRSLAGCQDEDLRGHEVLRMTIVAGACGAAFGLSMWIWAPCLIPSLQNVLNPWCARVLPYLNATIVPGNTVVGEGSDVRIAATAGHLTDAVLEIIENDAVIATHQMATGTNSRTAEFNLTALKTDCQYRVRSGGLFSDRYQIIVNPKSIIKNSQVRLTFPDYTQLPPQIFDDLSEPIEVLHGTQIRIDVDATLPAARSSLNLNGTSIPGEEVVLLDETGLWRHYWEITATDSEVQQGTITLLSEAGVQSDPFPINVRVLPDLPPEIVIDQPVLPELQVRPDQSIDLVYHAIDDFGCTPLHMISQKNGEPPSIRELPRDVRTEIKSELTVDLKELKVNSGDQLTIWLSITDSRPDEYGGPQLAESRKIRIQVADEAAPIGQQAVQNEAQSVLPDLTEALDGLKAAEQVTNELQKDLGEVGNMADFPKAPIDVAVKVKRLQDQLQKAEQALRRLTDEHEFAPQRLFQPELKRIQDVTENEVAEAKKQSGIVPLSDDLPQQREAVAATKESLCDAIDKLQQVRKDIDQRGKRLELAAQLDELARQQERLAEELNNGQDIVPEVQHKQQKVANALQEIVEQNLDAKSEQFAIRAEKATELTETAAELQQQQEALAKLDQTHRQEDRSAQLLDLIAREQEQIANEFRKLEEQARVMQPPASGALEQNQQNRNEATQSDQNGKPNALAKARKQMEAIPEKLRQNDLEQAETAAQQAGEHLQEEARSTSENTAAQPNANADNNAQRKKDDLKQLAKQQERVRDAIKAVRDDRPDEAVAKLQEQIADRTDKLRDKADELLQLPTDNLENQLAVREAREKLDQAQKQTKAAEFLTLPQGEQPKQAGEQREQAAKSLQEATQSLESVCKSCKQCSNCNKPGGSSVSHGGSPKSGDNPSEPKESHQNGNPSKISKPGSKSGETGQPSPKGQQPDSRKLAEAADKAQQTARESSPRRTQELAQDLNQLADAAAQQAGYPKRKSKPKGDTSEAQKPSNSSQLAGASRPENSSDPQGVKGNAGANQSKVAATQLRGRSTSNWTQSRRKLTSSVLDNQDSKIPEEFRSVVKDYFEELSRLESRLNTAEDKK